MRRISVLVLLAQLSSLRPTAQAGSAPPYPPGRCPGAAHPALLPGEALFVKHCAPCHGPDGRLGLNGAHDLTQSNLNAYGRAYLVQNGLGKMPGFKKRLSPQVIEQIVTYSMTLK